MRPPPPRSDHPSDGPPVDSAAVVLSLVGRQFSVGMCVASTHSSCTCLCVLASPDIMVRVCFCSCPRHCLVPTTTPVDVKLECMCVVRIAGLVVVAVRHHASSRTDIHYSDEPVPDFVRALVETCVEIHTRLPSGDILAFLPGSEEIDNAVQAIKVKAIPSRSCP